MPKFFHRYIEQRGLPFQHLRGGGDYVCYWTDFGGIKSSCTWMVPGSWSGE